MNRNFAFFICASLSLLFLSCGGPINENTGNSSHTSTGADISNTNLLKDVKPVYPDGDVNAIIEIPSGTLEKWELNKTSGQVEWEYVNDKPRVVNYLGYPGNYGIIPGTLLSKKQGGDGDPLDIIVLGPPAERGQVIKCKIIGVIFLNDSGEQDDKLIALSTDSPLYAVNNMKELNDNYSGISDILGLWFLNYKGPGKMEFKGYGDKNSAIDLLKSAIKEYQLYQAEHKIK